MTAPTLSTLRRSGFSYRQAKAIVDLAATISGPGPGGGGSLSPQTAEVWSDTPVLLGSGEGGIASVNWDTPYDPETSDEYDWFTAGTGGDAGKLLLPVEGWYDVRLIVSLTWPAAAAVTYVRSSFQVGNASIGNYEQLSTPVVHGANKRVTQLLNLGLLYSDGFAKISPTVRWDTGVYTATATNLHAVVTKIA